MSRFRFPLRYDAEYLRNGSPATIMRESFPRWACATDLTAPTTRPATVATPTDSALVPYVVLT